jgi:hypothetical protein
MEHVTCHGIQIDLENAWTGFEKEVAEPRQRFRGKESLNLLYGLRHVEQSLLKGTGGSSTSLTATTLLMLHCFSRIPVSAKATDTC